MGLPCTAALRHPFQHLYSLSENTIWVSSEVLEAMLEVEELQEASDCLRALSDSVPWPLSQRSEYFYNVCFLRLAGHQALRYC